MKELMDQLMAYVRGIWRYRWYAMILAWALVLGRLVRRGKTTRSVRGERAYLSSIRIPSCGRLMKRPCSPDQSGPDGSRS